MAAPTVIASDVGFGESDVGGAWAYGSSANPSIIPSVCILQILQDGSTSGAVALTGTTPSGTIADLAGTLDVWTFIGAFNVGSPTVAIQHLWIGRTQNNSHPIPAGTNSTSEDLYIRSYNFQDVSAGTTLATVIENVTAGSTVNGVGTSGTIADTGVTTLGSDRLALNFVAGSDDNAIDAFAGETGGDWVEAAAEYAESVGTDGVIQLQTAAMATAGTIDGGSDAWADATDGWGVVGFALIGTTVVAAVLEQGYVDFNDPGVL